ncbi:MAG UNVERIFIED_CONTAM: hypothetical protein LVQ98_00470 [Rickettsiaceae bacterium]
MNNINIKTSRMHFSDDTEDIESKLYLSNVNKDGVGNTTINYSSDIKLGETFSKDLAKGIKSFVTSTPSNSSFGILKDYLSPLNFELLDLNTGNDLIKFALEADITRAQEKKSSLDIKRLGVVFQDTEFHIKSLIHNDLKSDKWFSGVIEIVNWGKIIDYLVRAYSKVYTVNNMNYFNDTFWVDLYVDFLESIAGNINHDTTNLALQFNLSIDMSKSKIGRYTLPEAKILYYTKLFNHIYAVSNNRTEALNQFRMMIPSYISDPKIFEKVTIEK